MNTIIKVAALSCAIAGGASAMDKTLYFYQNSTRNDLCVSEKKTTVFCRSKENKEIKPYYTGHSMRIKILNTPEDKSSSYGIYIEKPFFIIDGIHLSTDEPRTLQQLQEDTEEFGIPNILQSLGYTPILVQFTETVRTSLQENSKMFRDLLRFISSNALFPFPNKSEDGFVILGISQGGIIGRFGAYLYDKARSSSDAPIRMYASLDSPHQGAVMPRSLMSTIGFWATFGHSESAEAFRDLIRGPGARDLLIYQTNTLAHQAKVSEDRFLFGSYRKAAEYKGFPTVLLSQGQLKGADPAHANVYYNLNRKATLAGATVGRVTSKIGYSNDESTEISHHSIYEKGGQDIIYHSPGISSYDFVQGSTYPFAKTMYKGLREGFLDAIPNNMKTKILGAHINIGTSWDHDNLYQESSTFIPTVSAMDLLCDGDLAIRKNCAHSQKSSGINFEKPGNISTGSVIFAVDPTHPRYKEQISGRHIESPMKSGKIDTTVLVGMQTDIWRILCEVAKYDYDQATGKFRNPKLNGMFSKSTNCMDATKMPDLIKNAGKLQTKKIAYARYDYNSKASEKDENVSFTLPAGWQKVATFNLPDDIPPGAAFEIDIRVLSPKSNWMKAELLLVRDAIGNGQIQLTETNVPQDGLVHTLRWVMPNTLNSTLHYKWLRLVLNSNGATIILSNPKIITSTKNLAENPDPISSSKIYPNSKYTATPWSDKVEIQTKTVGTAEMLYVSTAKRYDGLHFDFGKTVSMDKFTSLVVEFEPGTCTHTAVYFDAKDTGNPNLGNYSLQNGIANKILPLSKIIKTEITQNHSLSASRLKIQSTADNETCRIRSIYLQ